MSIPLSTSILSWRETSTLLTLVEYSFVLLRHYSGLLPCTSVFLYKALPYCSTGVFLPHAVSWSYIVPEGLQHYSCMVLGLRCWCSTLLSTSILFHQGLTYYCGLVPCTRVFLYSYKALPYCSSGVLNTLSLDPILYQRGFNITLVWSLGYGAGVLPYFRSTSILFHGGLTHAVSWSGLVTSDRRALTMTNHSAQCIGTGI